MTSEVKLKISHIDEISLDDDPELKLLLSNQRRKRSPEAINNYSWDDPIDLRVSAPNPIDLFKLWRNTNKEIPPIISASLGRSHPILLNHIVTPFAADGREPTSIWSLGYEVLVSGASARTISVAPTDEIYQAGNISQELRFGLSLDGGLSLVDKEVETGAIVSGLNLKNARIDLATNQTYQFSLNLHLTFRKIIGAPTSTGAVWKMYRQDERMDRPHSLFQTLLVNPEESELNCTVKTWAKQAGWLKTRWGAKLWRYDNHEFTVNIGGLSERPT